METMYLENLLSHYRRPQNYGKMKDADAAAKEFNIFCGDFVKMYIKKSGDKIQDVSFEGKGCVISQAAASILTKMARDKFFADIANLSVRDIVLALGIELSPTRQKCAELPLRALKKAVRKC